VLGLTVLRFAVDDIPIHLLVQPDGTGEFLIIFTTVSRAAGLCPFILSLAQHEKRLETKCSIRGHLDILAGMHKTLLAPYRH